MTKTIHEIVDDIREKYPKATHVWLRVQAFTFNCDVTVTEASPDAQQLRGDELPNDHNTTLDGLPLRVRS